MNPLTFRCTSCGNCCRGLRVAVTNLDVSRLVSATGRQPSELVSWLEPDAVDMTGEPESFVELDEGRRLMVLAQREGACGLLGADNLCTQYAARPQDCRAFPFDFEPSADAAGPRRLTLLPLASLLSAERCEYAEDGQHDAAALAAIDAARWQELRAYQALVMQWNRRAWHRKRLHKSLGNRERFLGYAMVRIAQPAQLLSERARPL